MKERVDIFVSLFDVENPFEFMRSLGIAWEAYEGQTVSDQVKFIGCTNLPDELPDFVRVRRTEV